MNCKLAFEILEINISELEYNSITLEYLKRQYHRLALQNHPDKNGNTEASKEKFQKINEAYNYLKREMKKISKENDEMNNDMRDEDDADTSIYRDILNLFIQSMMNGKYNDLFSTIIKDIVISCKKITSKLFEDLDKDTLMSVYTFLSKYRSVLHISDVILEEIRNIVVQKYENVEIYKLNPSINDLINNNIYKLNIDNQLYLVPLWHNESYFDCDNGKELIVICDPELPENISIDDYNNIHIDTKLNKNELVNMIMENEKINVFAGEKIYYIDISNLYMKREQYYRIYNQGLSKHADNIYDISEKGDVIIKITIV
jgi:curved DNA-binding protein CbpA